ncbi:AbrB/MazE/SpoVT family DNA-binding domain-containing protein [Candidatus Altiarchaeota archaeon]
MTKLSSKGQIVIPQSVRNSLGISPGTRFIVFEKDGNIVLKKIDISTPKIGI